MQKNIKANVSWVGYIDWELETFHGDDYSIFNGSSQNAYLIKEEKTVLIDTVWTPHRFDFIENLKQAVDLHKIDFIVINHGEADHTGALPALMDLIPSTPIYCTAAAVKSLEGQYGQRGWNFNVVKTGDTLDIGNGKKLMFIDMKMLHWPDSMATFLTGDNILFSNDAFGQHYGVQELFNDRADQCILKREALKYFVNILNPFAMLVSKKINEIKNLNLQIEMIAPSHGAIWRDNPMQIIDLYEKWSSVYQENQITIVYDTMWNGTAEIAHKISEEIATISPDTVVKVYQISKSDKNEVMTEIFKSKALILGSPTISNDVMASVSGWVAFLKQLKFKGKKAAAFGCYGWSGESVKILQEKLKDAGFEVIDESVKSLWKPNGQDFTLISDMVKKLV
ncbi:MAG: flavodoxin domain-containing protein [Alphaproteobacteria bacterium]|nr:flavodoxin domain-containing protein [Alphaproteobacteria bacterium]